MDLGGELRAHWEPGAIQVTFPNGRGQRIHYRRKGEHFLFTSRVATEGHLQHLSWESLCREILLRNRVTEVVAFRTRAWRHVEAWVEHRAATLRMKSLKFYLAHLAREADRFEFLLTGKDVH